MTALQSSAQKTLRRHVERIEGLQAQQKELGVEISDELKAAKSTGFDPKIIRRLVAIRRKGMAAHEEEEALLATYMHAVGLDSTPLGDYAAKQLQAAE